MKIIGHRGARGLAPENTVASLKKAIEHGADEVEFDVRVTMDGIPVLHHDAWLSDPDGRRLKIAACSLEQLRQHKADLATLAEAMDYVGQRLPVYIEIKPEEPLGHITTEISRCLAGGWSLQLMSFASFDAAVLNGIKAAFPDSRLVVLEKWSAVRATRRARQLGTRRITINQRWLWRGVISHLSRRGYQLGAYTVNDPAKARRWAGYGLSAVVTDYPDLFAGRRRPD